MFQGSKNFSGNFTNWEWLVTFFCIKFWLFSGGGVYPFFGAIVTFGWPLNTLSNQTKNLGLGQTTPFWWDFERSNYASLKERSLEQYSYILFVELWRRVGRALQPMMCQRHLVSKSKFPVVYKKNQMKETQQKTRKRDGMKSEQGSGRTTVLVKDHAWFALDIAISTFVNQFHTTV